MGTYTTKAEAVQRLREVEWYKAHPKKKRRKKASKDDTYSSIMRSLVKEDSDLTIPFQEAFKQAFDEAYVAGSENPDEEALRTVYRVLKAEAQQQRTAILKAASAVNLGDPEYAGKSLAALIKWMMQRISPDRRPKSIESMRRKIYYINEYAIAGKKVPPASSMGQSISIIKTILLEHSPQYIRAGLNAIARSL